MDMHKIITYFISLVWLINGLFCKVLNLVPRHQQIVARILGETYARELTLLIGFHEILIVVWILSRFKSKSNAIFQILIIIIMNFIEFFIAKDLLLWGAYNSIFALLFVSLIYYNEFIISKKNCSSERTITRFNSRMFGARFV